MIPVVPARLDWPSAIGNFILNYGVLDWHVLVFLEARLPADEFARIKGRHFQDRIALVKSLVVSGQYSDVQRQAFENFFVRLDPIRELRNHIAHGHMLCRWHEDAKTWRISLALPKDLDALDASGTRLLEFGELTKALSELPALIEEFQTLSGSWCEEQIELHVNRRSP
jgi:hypothetical protein